jgi:hypothetical protein
MLVVINNKPYNRHITRQRKPGGYMKCIKCGKPVDELSYYCDSCRKTLSDKNSLPTFIAPDQDTLPLAEEAPGDMVEEASGEIVEEEPSEKPVELPDNPEKELEETADLLRNAKKSLFKSVINFFLSMSRYHQLRSSQAGKELSTNLNDYLDVKRDLKYKKMGMYK